MKSLLIANWKMDPQTYDEAARVVRATRGAVEESRGITMVICPPAIFLRELVKKYGTLRSNGKRLSFGVQNIFAERVGAATGELSVDMAHNAGVEYVLVGHSERRKFGETNTDVAKKAMLALKAGMFAVVCVGESVRDEQGTYLKELERQVQESIPQMPRRYYDRLIVAYEPVWAIGESAVRSATPHEIFETTLYIRKVIASMFTKEFAFKVPVLYGGSVDAVNAVAVLSEGGVEGLLIGRASLQEKTFPELIVSIANAK